MSIKSMVIDRRAFLSGAGLMAGAVVATSLVPLSAVHALPSAAPGGSLAAAESEGTWHVDDICGHWPPYAHPIGYGHAGVASAARSHASMLAHADAIDHVFLS
jgi:hypothetical protein